MGEVYGNIKTTLGRNIVSDYMNSHLARIVILRWDLCGA